LKLKEVIEYIGSSEEGGGGFPLDHTNPELIKAMLPSLRTSAIQISYNGNKMTAATKVISPLWSQSFSLTVEPSTKEYLEVSCPLPMSISSTVGGVLYFGKEDAISRFVTARSLAEVADFKARGYLNDGRNIITLPRDGGIYWIWGDSMLRAAYFVGVLNNPYDAPNWSDLTSEFPIDDKCLNIMRDLYRAQVSTQVSKAIDNVLDGADSTQLPVIKNSVK